MSEQPSISEAEWKIMKLLWKKAPQPAYDLALQLSETEKWNPRTVKTLLNRLLNKGALKFETYKNLYLYTPAVAEKHCVKAETQSFLDQVFDGSLSTMMLHFAQNQKMSKSEIQELKDVLNQMEAGDE